jgi:hypothetical protein
VSFETQVQLRKRDLPPELGDAYKDASKEKPPRRCLTGDVSKEKQLSALQLAHIGVDYLLPTQPRETHSRTPNSSRLPVPPRQHPWIRKKTRRAE